MKSVIERVEEYSLEELMGERFGRYSKYIIQDRAIPDVRDGLKPVQRRILYSMYKSHNTFDKKRVKCANAVGDIMGKYHPHGDSSIYEALVRMSQPWKVRIPYIDFQGNNGSIDGDGPAAYRYTESRLSKFSNTLLKDIEKNTVKMAPNYADTLLEPTVLPAGFPNLLVGGAMGISAGYATNIPPHNLGEVIDATIKRIDSPNCTLDTIMQIMPGPDFPTGGIALGKKGIKDAYETGKGKIFIRSNYTIEKDKKGQQIILHDLPYEVNRAALIKRINDIRIDKKIDGIIDARDESDKEVGYRIAIELKKDANAEFIVNYLLKNTDMQVSYNYNMIVIANRRPKQLGLLAILDYYIAHKKEVVINRTKFDLENAKNKLHILEGLLKAIGILDEVIRVIRASKNKSDAINNLVKEFDFTEVQATAIVNLQLYRLTNTDINEIKEEISKLQELISMYEEILNDENVLKKVMKDELRSVKKEFALPRITKIEDEAEEIKIDETMLIPKEDVIVVVTNEGYVKRVSKKSYGAADGEPTLVKENDYVIGLYEQNTLDTLLLFTNLGNYLYVPVHELPELKWKDLGKHISNIVPIEQEEKIIKTIPVSKFDKREIMTFTKNGMVKKSLLEDFKVQRYSKSMMYIKLKDNDEVINVTMDLYNEVFIATRKGYGLWYDRSEVPTIGLRTAGVKSINLKDDEVVSAGLFDGSNEYITVLTYKGLAKRIKLSEIEKTSRAKRGLLLLREVKSNPQQIIKTLITDVKNSIIIKTNDEEKEFKLTEIPIMDRYSIGSMISKTVIDDIYDIVTLEKDNLEEEQEVSKPITKEESRENKEVSLKEIDDKFLTIDDFLDNFD